jgi:hypothetical protein
MYFAPLRSSPVNLVQISVSTLSIKDSRINLQQSERVSKGGKKVPHRDEWLAILSVHELNCVEDGRIGLTVEICIRQKALYDVIIPHNRSTP